MKDENVTLKINKQILAQKEAIRLHLRAQEYMTKWTQWEKEFDKQTVEGNASTEFWKDEVYNSLIAERKQISQDLNAVLAQKHSEDKIKPQEFRDILPEEKNQMQQMLVEQLKSTPSEIFSKMSPTWEDLIQTISERIVEMNLKNVEDQIHANLKNVSTGLEDKPPTT